MDNVLNLPTENDAFVAASRKDSTTLLETAELIVIDSEDMNTIANDALSAIHKAGQELERRKKTVLDPLRDAVEATRELFRPAENALDAAKTTLKRKIGAWLDEVEQRREKAAEQLRQEQQAKLAAAQARLAEVLESETTSGAEREAVAAAVEEVEQSVDMAGEFAMVDAGDMGRNSDRKAWKAKVVNLPAFLRYLADDLESDKPKFDGAITASDVKVKQLQAFATATAGSVDIPGILFTQERTITARRS